MEHINGMLGGSADERVGRGALPSLRGPAGSAEPLCTPVLAYGSGLAYSPAPCRLIGVAGWVGPSKAVATAGVLASMRLRRTRRLEGGGWAGGG